MKRLHHLPLLLALLCTALSLHAQSPVRLETVNGAMRLVQDGRPLLLLGGELHNSSSSTHVALLSSMQTAKAMGMNAVITTVAWEQIEPDEGRYDFTSIDDIISVATALDMYVGVAWFGTWKNGESSYAPLWVKRDTQRFYRARTASGENTTTISPFCEAAQQADAKAFSALLARIKERDVKRKVCVVQVENEVGVFLDRDHCAAADEAFQQAVPGEVTAYLKKHRNDLAPRLSQRWKEQGQPTKGTWTALFGDNEDAKQFFMAWSYARYVDRVTAAGKAAYALPMYTNCWLASDDQKVGAYPNGGPRMQVYDIWKAVASHVDWLSPDVYSRRYHEVFSYYHRADNPLFIPEVSREAGPAYYAFGEHDAACYAPFGFEETYNDPYLLGEYQTLGELLPLISDHQGTGRMHGFVRQEGIDAADDSTHFTLGGYRFTVKYVKGEWRAHGLVIQTSDDTFVTAGVGCFIEVASTDPALVAKVGYAEEVARSGEAWQTLYVLNGDETAHHNMLYLRGRMPLKDFSDYGFQIPAPLYRPSYQRMNEKQWQDPLKYSGIYRFKLYTYPRR